MRAFFSAICLLSGGGKYSRPDRAGIVMDGCILILFLGNH